MNHSFLRTFALSKYYLYGLKKNPVRLFLLITWPISDLLIWSFTANYIQTNNSANNFLISTIVCFLSWSVLWQIQSEMSYPFLRDIYGKNLRNLIITPINFFEITIALFLSGIAKILISSLAIIVIAYSAFYVNVFIIDPIFVFLFFNILLFGITLGIISISFIVRFGPQLDFLIRTLPFFLWPFMCVYYPRTSLPAPIQTLTYLVPPSYVFENIRNSLQKNPILISDLWKVTGLNLIYLLLSILFLQIMLTQTRKRGNFARM
jgi:ABC-2 type transport system permease protein